MARLDIMEGVNVIASVVVEDEVIIGRRSAKQNQPHFVNLSDHRISRQHVRITRTGWTFLLEDLGSINGTILRGETIASGTPYDLYNGDDIWLASVHLIFYAEEEKLTLQQPAEPVELPPEPVELPAEPATASLGIRAGMSGALPMVRRIDDTIPVQVSAVLDASIALRLSHLIAAHDQSMPQEATRRQLQALCQVSAALGTLENRDMLMQNLVEVILEIFPMLDRVCILLCRDSDPTLIPAAAKERHASEAVQDVAIAQAVITEVLTKKHAVRSLDTFAHGHVPPPDATAEASLRGVMCVPLLVDDEEVLGLIHADTSSQPHALTDQDLEVLTGIGTQAAIAMKNVQLYDAVQHETAQRSSVLRTLSPTLADLCRSGAAHSALEGQRERGTILCADMIGLTIASATMSPPRVIARLQRYVTVMQRLIHEHGGNLDRCSGEHLTAFWGVFKPDQEDEGEAVRTALHMHAELWPLNLHLEAEDQFPIALGIGLHSGALIAGNIGAQDTLALTVIGESSALAAQIAALAAPAQVFIAESTWQPIRQLVGAIQLPPLTLSGNTAPLTLYAIRSIRQHTRSGCLLALPCAMLNRDAKPLGYGLITESTAPGKALRLFFSTACMLQPGEVLTLQPVVPEYHAPLPCIVRVESSVRQAHENRQVFTKAVLTILEGSVFTEMVTPGNCMTTSRSWEALGRE